MARLFIELLCEEIPARMQVRGGKYFYDLLKSDLESLGLSELKGDFYVGPRRLAVVFEDVPLKCPDRQEERRGPRVDAGEGPVQGFLSSLGLASDQVQVRETPKGSFYFAVQQIKGAPLEDCLPSLIDRALKAIPWPASMTWGWGTVPWVRPLKSIVCLLDNRPMIFEIKFGDHPDAPRVQSRQTTLGHRFLSQGPVAITVSESYEQTLQQAYVMVDHRKRRQEIWQHAQALAESKGLVIVDDPQLLDEVTGLVEWPDVLMGSIKPEFMVLPQEVLMTSMRVHQRYFALRDQAGALAPFFIFVANLKATDGGRAIIQGNERVLRARLSDALFFYTQDRKTPLKDYTQGLEKITFHGQLGTLADKTKRLEGLSGFLATQLGQNADQAMIAASLLKSDLLTDMVGEFPELQGIMGSYYALHEGYDPDVALAIREHYLPKLTTDSCPASSIGTIVALADRIDSLVGFFGVGIQPTGSKDPFALRRAMLGIIRILEKGCDLLLQAAFAQAFDLYEGKLKKSKTETLGALQAFYEDRLKVYWREQGLRLDCITGVLSVGQGESLKSLKNKVQALQTMVISPSGHHVISLYKRAANILGKSLDTYTIDPGVFVVAEEKSLYDCYLQSKNHVENALHQGQFDEALRHLLALEAPMDSFFTAVLVNDDNLVLRQNRLALIRALKELFEKVADFSSIEAG